ncbi:MAG: pilus assembly protein PilP [Thermodesulfovibrionales bacterium]|jgi:Tfp pilus assembly protein PilP
MRLFLCLPIALILAVALPSHGGEPAKEQTAQDKTGYEYNSMGKRDPFIPLIVKQEKLKPKKGSPPLESYDVSELKLIAVLWGGKRSFAVVMLPDGKSYTIKDGDRIGLSNGKVYKITKDSVIIREMAKDYRGTVRERDLFLKLHREEE